MSGIIEGLLKWNLKINQKPFKEFLYLKRDGSKVIKQTRQ